MYDLFHDLSVRPKPFSRYTAKTLWTRPHLAEQMLNYHLNQDTDLASRKVETIDRVVSWLDGQLQLSNKSLCDLGCGPGLYTQRFATRGADVTGVDFSNYTLNYAKQEANKSGQNILYINADYLLDKLPKSFDVVTLIYCDLCALSYKQRSTLLKRMHNMLNPGGKIVIDVAGIGSLKQKQEQTILEDKLMGGFWASGEYVGLQRSYLYKSEHLALDRYLIVEPNESWQIFNWFQHFTPDRLIKELNLSGFEVATMVGSLSGEPLQSESEFIGVIAHAKQTKNVGGDSRSYQIIT
ncbi:MAG: class I SAM-dependent methyltransferase [Magnetococcales bacterium]|nr:class I SAM-dependent methyltransferase [Magnetococcales bacterium]